MNNKKHIEDILYYFEKYHYENMILDDNEAKFIHDYIINLQSKIDKAIEYIENNKIYQWNTYRDEDFQLCGEKIESDMISKSAILDILKEDK